MFPTVEFRAMMEAATFLRVPAQEKPPVRYTPVGVAVRRLRKERGWSQGDLAKKCGLKVTTLSQIERGQKPNPTLDTLERVAEVFEVSIEDLRLDEREPLPQALKRVIDSGLLDATPRQIRKLRVMRGVVGRELGPDDYLALLRFAR
jgi:transcriptional regulator with XRE-family HTH domain